MDFQKIDDLFESSILGGLLRGFLYGLLGSFNCQFLGLLFELVYPLTKLDLRVGKIIFQKVESFDEQIKVAFCIFLKDVDSFIKLLLIVNVLPTQIEIHLLEGSSDSFHIDIGKSI